ncbi:hypothetical protein DV736_g2669, partial [Chaetothyriales sp. CBS 134916]
MSVIKAIVVAILLFSFILFVSLFGSQPIFRKTPISFLNRLIRNYIPHLLRRCDQAITGGRLDFGPHHRRAMLAYPYDYLLFHPGYFCTTCRVPKPARSKHCSLCKACIQKSDHHCIWISNCVGRNNYVWFVAMVASVTIMLAYGVCLGYGFVDAMLQDKLGVRGDLVRGPSSPRGEGSRVTVMGVDTVGRHWREGMSWGQVLDACMLALVLCPRVVATTMLCIMCWPLAMGFAVYHGYLIWAGMTTNESSKWAEWKEDVGAGEVWRARLDVVRRGKKSDGDDDDQTTERENDDETEAVGRRGELAASRPARIGVGETAAAADDQSEAQVVLLGHAVSGSIGTSISNAATYPLDLIITRLQVQRRLQREGEHDGSDQEKEDQGGVRDAITSVYRDEGGLSGFYAGVRQDTARAMADSFLFFLLCSFLRERRVQRRLGLRADGAGSATKSLGAVDELAVCFVAGALTQAATTPLANVVTRKQTAGPGADKQSTREVLEQIRRERGLGGLWSGYSAGVVLALNPSLTIVLFEALKRVLLPRSRRADPPPALTIVLAAMSKAIATSITYPFSVARSRLQAGGREAVKDDNADNADNAFTVLRRISDQEGWQSLYPGVGLEACKEFCSHGMTLLAKQVIQKVLLQLYSILSIMLGRYRSEADAQQIRERARENMEYYNLGLERAADKIEAGIRAMQSKANETAEFIGEYVEEESADWKELYGTTGLDRWLKGER